MSNSSLVNYKKLVKNYTPMSGKVNKKITIHHMAGNLSVETCANVFNGDRQASSNYGIGSDGRIGLYVEEHNRAWTSSSAWNDEQAVTIEVANNNLAPTWTISEKAMNSLILLCVDICKRNNIEKLTYTGDKNGTLTLHRFYANTCCPGPYIESKISYICNEVNRRLNPVSAGAKVLYRVRKTWDNAKTQLGAFSVLDNAKKLVNKNPGYHVYDNSGKQVYPVQTTPVKPPVTAPSKPVKPLLSLDSVARAVINGKYGNEPQRSKKLRAEGYDPVAVQNRVNEIVYGVNKRPSVTEVARRVIRGDYGNDPARSRKLRDEGYDPVAVQNEVNRLMGF